MKTFVINSVSDFIEGFRTGFHEAYHQNRYGSKENQDASRNTRKQ